MVKASSGNIVWAYVLPSRPPTDRLWAAMVAEFERNGRRMLSPGKVRYLRRVVRRGTGSR